MRRALPTPAGGRNCDDAVVKAAQAIMALEDLKAEAAADPSIFVDGPSHTAWRAKVLSVLSTSMGAEHETMIAFRDLPYNVPVWVGGPNAAAEDAQHFREAVEHGVALLDAAILALNLDADNDPAALPLPRPEGCEQEALVGVIWDWWQRRSAWPTYSQVLRAYDQRADGDCLAVWRELPDGLVIPSSPPSIPSQTQTLALTLAGAIVCGFSGPPLTTFVAMVRLANQRWRDINLDADEETVQVTSTDAKAAAEPEELSTAELALIGSFLGSEPVGLGSSSQLAEVWTMTFREGIRRYRDIDTIADYWRRRSAVLDGTGGVPFGRATMTTMSPPPPTNVPKRRVFLVHGRNMAARAAMVKLLKAWDLRIIEWEQAVTATGQGSPYTGDVVRAGLDMADAVVVLFTPDDIGQAHPDFVQHGDRNDETEPTGQARLNVVFEAGMAMALNRDKVILVEVGKVRAMSDTDGINVVHLTDAPASRRALGSRLMNVGLAVEMDHDEWRTAGEFDPTVIRTL